MKKKTIIITGASSGFGFEMAKTLAKQGHRLALGARRSDQLMALATSLSNETDVLAKELDVTNPISVHEFVKCTCEHFDDLDVLINNAGLALGKDYIENANAIDFETMMNTNYFGSFYMTKTVLPYFVKKNEGQVIFIGSIAGHEVYEGGAGYCASKFALKALTQTLRQETHYKNIRVCSIDPGMAITEFSRVRFKGDESKAMAVYEGVKALSPHDIAQAVLYVLNQPEHVNIDEIRLTPTQQACASKIHRNKR